MIPTITAILSLTVSALMAQNLLSTKRSSTEDSIKANAEEQLRDKNSYNKSQVSHIPGVTLQDSTKVQYQDGFKTKEDTVYYFEEIN